MPWKAPENMLLAAGVELGVVYPHRIVVDLAAERAMGVEAVLCARRANQRSNDKSGINNMYMCM